MQNPNMDCCSAFVKEETEDLNEDDPSQGSYYVAVVLDFWFSNYWYPSFILKKLSTRSSITSNKISTDDISSVKDMDL